MAEQRNKQSTKQTDFFSLPSDILTLILNKLPNEKLLDVGASNLILSNHVKKLWQKRHPEAIDDLKIFLLHKHLAQIQNKKVCDEKKHRDLLEFTTLSENTSASVALLRKRLQLNPLIDWTKPDKVCELRLAASIPTLWSDLALLSSISDSYAIALITSLAKKLQCTLAYKIYKNEFTTFYLLLKTYGVKLSNQQLYSHLTRLVIPVLHKGIKLFWDQGVGQPPPFNGPGMDCIIENYKYLSPTQLIEVIDCLKHCEEMSRFFKSLIRQLPGPQLKSIIENCSLFSCSIELPEYFIVEILHRAYPDFTDQKILIYDFLRHSENRAERLTNSPNEYSLIKNILIQTIDFDIINAVMKSLFIDILQYKENHADHEYILIKTWSLIKICFQKQTIEEKKILLETLILPIINNPRLWISQQIHCFLDAYADEFSKQHISQLYDQMLPFVSHNSNIGRWAGENIKLIFNRLTAKQQETYIRDYFVKILPPLKDQVISPQPVLLTEFALAAEHFITTLVQQKHSASEPLSLLLAQSSLFNPPDHDYEHHLIKQLTTNNAKTLLEENILPLIHDKKALEAQFPDNNIFPIYFVFTLCILKYETTEALWLFEKEILPLCKKDEPYVFQAAYMATKYFFQHIKLTNNQEAGPLLEKYVLLSYDSAEKTVLIVDFIAHCIDAYSFADVFFFFLQLYPDSFLLMSDNDALEKFCKRLIFLLKTNKNEEITNEQKIFLLNSLLLYHKEIFNPALEPLINVLVYQISFTEPQKLITLVKNHLKTLLQCPRSLYFLLNHLTYPKLFSENQVQEIHLGMQSYLSHNYHFYRSSRCPYLFFKVNGNENKMIKIIFHCFWFDKIVENADPVTLQKFPGETLVELIIDKMLSLDEIVRPLSDNHEVTFIKNRFYLPQDAAEILKLISETLSHHTVDYPKLLNEILEGANKIQDNANRPPEVTKFYSQLKHLHTLNKKTHDDHSDNASAATRALSSI